MKNDKPQKQLILLALILSLTALHVQAQDHLWKFNEGTGTTSADSVFSSGPINAVLNSATWSAHNSGSAVHLDGTDSSYVSLGKSVGQFGAQDFSVSLWIQTSDNSISVGDIIGHRTDPGHGNFLSVRMTQDGHVTAEVDQDTSGTNYIATKSNVGGLNNGQWHYLVITRSGKTLSLYIDGALSGSATGNGITNINNGREMKIGRSLVYSSYSRFSLSATFDDVAVYSVALTAAQIAYQFGRLDHLWRFDEGSGTISVDSISSSSSFQAALNNVHWNHYTSGAAVYLDGTDGSYVSFGKSAGQFGTQDFSVALWIQTSDKSISVGDIIGHRTDPSHGNFLSVRMTQDGHVTAEIDQDTTGTNYIPVTSSVGGLNNGQWHYLVITRSGKALALYVDGVLSANTTGNGVTNINNGRELKLGRSLVYSGYSRFSLSASFDDVAIYSVALTSTQIASQYQAGTSFSSGTTTTTSPPGSDNAQSCWLDSYGRGVGRPLSSCPSGQDKNGALCYPACSSGYTGAGPVCWQNCPSGFTDTGADCLKPEAYGRGAGYALWDEDKCNNENPQGCEKNGALYYPKCKDGYYAFGCCICSPTCVSGMTDIGVSCQKNSYGRGAGTPLTCASNEEEDAALCYTQCKAGYDGVGPVCWGGCPESLYQCGALCLESAEECTEKMLEIGLKAAEGVLEIALDIENPIGVAIAVAKTVADIAPELIYPVCSS